jgi:hypothetical protein
LEDVCEAKADGLPLIESQHIRPVVFEMIKTMAKALHSGVFAVSTHTIGWALRGFHTQPNYAGDAVGTPFADWPEVSSVA